jgi:hypothetical protein
MRILACQARALGMIGLESLGAPVFRTPGTPQIQTRAGRGGARVVDGDRGLQVVI